MGQPPVFAEGLPLVRYVADRRDAVCDEGHLRGVATIAGAVFRVQKSFPAQGVQQDEGFPAFQRVGELLRQGVRSYRNGRFFGRRTADFCGVRASVFTPRAAFLYPLPVLHVDGHRYGEHYEHDHDKEDDGNRVRLHPGDNGTAYEGGGEQPHRTGQQDVYIEIFGHSFHLRLRVCKFGVDQTDGVVFLLVDDFRVYLRGLHVRVAEQLADRVEVRAERQQHRREGVAAHVVGYVLGNARALYPRFDEGIAGILARQRGKYRLFFVRTVPFRHPFPGLRGEGQVKRLACLLHDDAYMPLFARAVHVLPFQGQHVADTQPAVAGEEERPLDVLPPARGVDKRLYLVYGQELPLALRHLDLLVRVQLVDGVLSDNILPHGGVQRPTETAEIGDAGKLRQLLPVGADIGVAQKIYEGEAEIAVYVAHGRFLVERAQDVHRVADELAAAAHAFLLLTLLVGLHPVEQQHFGAMGSIFQPRRVVCQFDDALRLDRVHGRQRRFVLRLGCRARLGNKVKFQELVLTPAVPVNVEIDGLAAVAERLVTDAHGLLDLGLFGYLYRFCHNEIYKRV